MTCKPVCYIFGAGQPPACPPKINARDIVVAADGGYDYARSSGIRIDALIGDFDSIGAFPGRERSNLLVRRLPKEKDQTDLLAALQYGLELGYMCFRIYGGTGGRIDHTLANIQCLGYLVNHGARGYLHDGSSVVTALKGEIWLAARRRGVISVFALGGAAEGVSLRGLKYELTNARLDCDFPLGVSNAFTGLPVHIKAERGILLVVYPAGIKELEKPPE